METRFDQKKNVVILGPNFVHSAGLSHWHQGPPELHAPLADFLHQKVRFLLGRHAIPKFWKYLTFLALFCTVCRSSRAFQSPPFTCVHCLGAIEPTSSWDRLRMHRKGLPASVLPALSHVQTFQYCATSWFECEMLWAFEGKVSPCTSLVQRASPFSKETTHSL